MIAPSFFLMYTLKMTFFKLQFPDDNFYLVTFTKRIVLVARK